MGKEKSTSQNGVMSAVSVQERSAVRIREEAPDHLHGRGARSGLAVGQLVCVSPGTVGLLDLDSISSCLSGCLKQQNGFRAISLIKKVE